MDKFLTDPLLKVFLRIAFISFLLYLPTFIVPYAFHNDGAYIFSKGSDIFNAFNEGTMVFVMGRPILAAYFGLQSWLISNFLDLSICRVISFLFLTIFNYILFRYLIRTCRVPVFWAACIVTVCFFIPPHLLSVMWCNLQGPVVFNILLATLSYFLFNRAFQHKNILGVMVAGIFFLTALFCYPASAFIFFVFTFAKVVFLDSPQEGRLRDFVMRDILFVFILMGIFRLLAVKYVVPWGLEHFKVEQSAGLYSLELSNNFMLKAKLLLSILGFGFRGIWDFSGKWIGSGIVLIFVGIAVYFGVKAQSKLRFSKHIIERFVWGIILFILGNTPVLLAQGLKSIDDVGYRVLAAPMIMGTLLIFKIFILAQKRSILNIKKLAIIFISFTLLLAFWLEIKTVEEHHQEYELAMKQLSQIDLSKTNQLLFVVNPRGKGLTDQHLPFEFSLLSVIREHICAYFIEHMHGKSYAMDYPFIAHRGSKIFVPAGTRVIDLSSEAISAPNPRNDDIAIRPQSSLAEHVTVKVIFSTDQKDVFMNFQTVSYKKAVPLWVIESDEKQVSLEIISSKPLPLIGYNCFVVTEDPKLQEQVKWVLQGSNDGFTWINLDVQANIMPLEKAIVLTYPLKDQVFFTRYRFVWNKEQFDQGIGVELIKLRFLNGQP